jgi:hypothetical protein
VFRQLLKVLEVTQSLLGAAGGQVSGSCCSIDDAESAALPAWSPCKVKTSRSKRWWVAPHSLTNANCTFCALSRALAPYQRLVAVSNGLQQHSVISVCIVGGPSASFAILAQTSVMCGCCSGATRNGAAAGSIRAMRHAEAQRGDADRRRGQHLIKMKQRI